MLKSKILDAIGARQATDKGSQAAAHDYLRKYEFFSRNFEAGN